MNQDILLDEKRLNENNWSLPPLISIFLMNTLETKDKGNVLPWLYCKKVLFDIYVDRIQATSEMSNIILFFMYFFKKIIYLSKLFLIIIFLTRYLWNL